MYLYRHDSCYDRHSDTNATTVCVELEESFRFKEELCDDEVSTSIHLLLQMLDVLLVGRAVGMSVGVA